MKKSTNFNKFNKNKPTIKSLVNLAKWVGMNDKEITNMAQKLPKKEK